MLPKDYAEKIFKRARQRSRDRGIVFTITLHDVMDLSVPVVCPAVGIPLKHKVSTSQTDDSVSIDRIDSTRGYEPDNVHLISWRANRLKSNATLDELIMLGKFCEELKQH